MTFNASKPTKRSCIMVVGARLPIMEGFAYNLVDNSGGSLNADVSIESTDCIIHGTTELQLHASALDCRSADWAWNQELP